MTQEKWMELVGRIKTMTKVIRHETFSRFKEISTPAGKQRIEDGTVEEVEFERFGKKMKLSRWVRPKVEKVKILSHRRVEGATVQYEKSKTEMVATESLYKWNDTEEEWEEVDIDALGR